jgi:hypothetical protein
MAVSWQILEREDTDIREDQNGGTSRRRLLQARIG